MRRGVLAAPAGVSLGARATRAGLLAASLLGTAAFGQSPLAPGSAAAPAERPEAPAAAPIAEQTPEAPAASPLPPKDPDAGAEAPAQAPAPAEPPVPEQLAEDDAGLAACLGRLRAFGTAFERVDTVSDQGGACGIVNPVSVAEILPGVALEPAGVMRCATAAALAEWVSTFVLPASRLLPERGPLTAIGHASTYVCRGVGGDGGDLSQHAFGNAVDVMGLHFAEGPPIPVEPRQDEGSMAEAFQRTARASACLAFTTVLGPGEEDHNDHLHLDIESRQSGYRLCQ